MLLLNICKNVCRTRVRQFGRVAGSQRDQMDKGHQSLHQERKLLKCSMITKSILKRFNSNEEQNPPRRKIRLPPLTDDKLIVIPNVFKALISSYYLHAVLKARLDSDFSMPDFVNGSKQAVEVVSHALAQGDYESLVGLVANGVIEQLKERVSKLSEAQRELLPIKKEDIYIYFPYNIAVVNEGDEDRKRTFVEITMVYFSLKGFSEILNRREKTLQMRSVPEYQENLYLCNYRFRRDYTDSNTEPWIVTMCNELIPMAAL